MSHGKSPDKNQPEFNAFLRTTLANLSMPPLYEVLFLFSAPQRYLAEIKRLEQPTGTPKTMVYQWLWIQAAAVTTLQFVDMSISPHQQRTFKEGLLWFDDAYGELRFSSGHTVQLVTETSNTLPQPLMRLVNLHLS